MLTIYSEWQKDRFSGGKTVASAQSESKEVPGVWRTVHAFQNFETFAHGATADLHVQYQDTIAQFTYGESYRQIAYPAVYLAVASPLWDLLVKMITFAKNSSCTAPSPWMKKSQWLR